MFITSDGSEKDLGDTVFTFLKDKWVPVRVDAYIPLYNERGLKIIFDDDTVGVCLPEDTRGEQPPEAAAP